MAWRGHRAGTGRVDAGTFALVRDHISGGLLEELRFYEQQPEAMSWLLGDAPLR